MGDGFVHIDDELVHQGHFVRVVEGTFRAPDGAVFRRDIVRSRGAVGVVPLREVDGVAEVVLVRQYRPAFDAELIEIPAGVRDVDGEEPATTAQRELGEEVGLQAGRLDPLGELYPSPGMTDAVTWLFLATDLREVPLEAHGPEEEAMEILRMPLSEALAAIDRGEIVDSKTVIALLMTDRRIRAAG